MRSSCRKLGKVKVVTWPKVMSWMNRNLCGLYYFEIKIWNGSRSTGQFSGGIFLYFALVWVYYLHSYCYCMVHYVGRKWVMPESEKWRSPTTTKLRSNVVGVRCWILAWKDSSLPAIVWRSKLFVKLIICSMNIHASCMERYFNHTCYWINFFTSAIFTICINVWLVSLWITFVILHVFAASITNF